MARERLIIALDFPGANQALAIVDDLGDAIIFYKVGFELFSAEGMTFVRKLLEMEKKVFLDLKLYDIGETVKKTVRVVAREGVSFLTVHGNDQILRAAVEGRGDSALKLLAVTVLTSLDAADLQQMGIGSDVSALVRMRAENALRAGCDGVITSPQEAAMVREATGGELLLVTPGIRPAGAEVQDQKRIATPAAAIANGADYLVVGRPVTGATQRRVAVEAIQAEMQAAFDAR